jgi:hypothetical protein
VNGANAGPALKYNYDSADAFRRRLNADIASKARMLARLKAQ